jgi:hypothetical protein
MFFVSNHHLIKIVFGRYSHGICFKSGYLGSHINHQSIIHGLHAVKNKKDLDLIAR